MIGPQHDEPRIQIIRHVLARLGKRMDTGKVASLTEISAKPFIQFLRHGIDVALELLGTILRQLRDRGLSLIPVA